MPDRRDEDSGAIAWPGFVDILSAVIIMFVFFVMITAIVMYVMSVEHQEAMESENEQKLQAEIENLKEEILNASISDLQLEKDVQKNEQVQTLTAEVSSLTEEIKQLKADLAKTVDQDTIMSEDNKTLTILYKKNEMSLSPAAEATITEFLRKNGADSTDDLNLVLETGDAPNGSSITLMRELSLARTLNIRNVMLAEKIDSTNISVHYKDPEEVEGSYHWVRIRLK